jgi:hypothetical protein
VTNGQQASVSNTKTPLPPMNQVRIVWFLLEKLKK